RGRCRPAARPGRAVQPSLACNARRSRARADAGLRVGAGVGVADRWRRRTGGSGRRPPAHLARRRGRPRRHRAAAQPSVERQAVMTRGHYRVIAAAMVIAAIAVAGTVVRPAGRMVRTAAGGVAPVGSSTVVCPNVSGGPGGMPTDMMVAHVTSGAVPKVQYSVVRTPGERAVQHLEPAPLAVVHK